MAISHVLIPNQATFPRLLEKILKGNEAKKKKKKEKNGSELKRRLREPSRECYTDRRYGRRQEREGVKTSS